MSKRKWITIATFILGIACVLPLQATGENPMGETSQKPSVPLSQFLVELGKDNDRFFTIEESWKDAEPWNKLESHLVQRFSEKRSFQQELEQLRQTVPNFTYEINRADPRIIHIMEASLLDHKEYGLERVINSIDFTGRVNDLPAQIEKQGIAVSQMLWSTHEQPDYTTPVHVKGERLKVRDILSNFIPLEGRGGRILWIARTKLGPGSVTYFYYPWPGNKP